MGLFDKKYCDICGKEIKFLGNKKLDDGNMCKDCASKLSPWFSGRRHTSVANIKEQLAYREENEKKLASFYPSKIVGDRYKVYIDEKNKLIGVSSASDWRKDNPDLISFDDVLSFNVDIDEDQTEIFDEDKDGNEVSFDPPKYEYEYSFNVKFMVKNKYFDDISFKLNNKEVKSPDSDEFKEYVKMCNDISTIVLGKEFKEDRSGFKYESQEETKEESQETESSEWFCSKCGTKNDGNFCSKCGAPKPVAFEPFFCTKCGEKITDESTAFCPKCGNKLK